MTRSTIPAQLDTAEVAVILEGASKEESLGLRIARISSVFLGRPYICGPLVGDAIEPEVFIV